MIDQEINEAVARGLGLSPYRSSEGYLVHRSHPKIEKRVPNYCHDIKAAWEIVASLLGRGLQVRVDMTETWTDVLIFNPGAPNNVNLANEQADTAAMALCLAFLKLLEAIGTKTGKRT